MKKRNVLTSRYSEFGGDFRRSLARARGFLLGKGTQMDG
jgi:hypothetical protein